MECATNVSGKPNEGGLQLIRSDSPGRLSWVGGYDPHFDHVQITKCANAELGVFGGSTASGAVHNEDGALIWTDVAQGWTFAAVLDGHAGFDSTEAVIRLIESARPAIAKLLDEPVNVAFPSIEKYLNDALRSEEFVEECQQLTGETAVLICAQKGGYLWWMSIGDNLLYVLHPELARLGQYTVNTRHFFQWVGRVNSLMLDVPAFTSGVFELRQGLNRILLVTDGLLEFGSRPFESGPHLLASLGEPESEEGAVLPPLRAVQDGEGKDSATIVSWDVHVERAASIPSG